MGIAPQSPPLLRRPAPASVGSDRRFGGHHIDPLRARHRGLAESGTDFAIRPGLSRRVRAKWIPGRGFRQRGNALTAIEVPDFDPAMLHREGFKLVINVQTNQFERFQEEAEPSPPARLGRNLWSWLERSLQLP